MREYNDDQSRHDGPHFGLILALMTEGLAISEYPEMVRVANIAESYGFGSIWLCDHFLTLSPDDYVQHAGISGVDGQRQGKTRPATMPLLEAWTALSALARDTTNIRLGTSVLCNSYRHPSVLAKMAATLDVISEGRLDLGLGADQGDLDAAQSGVLGPVLHAGRSRLRPTARAEAPSTTVGRRRRRPGAPDRRPLCAGDQRQVVVAREGAAAQRFPCAGLCLGGT
jgi:alkanesulfonate monooxygenase SsuD/methylene tetrahydromethanopterin reductase-like flavin-dependent oxidoreductase (luciferase family)